MLGAGISGFQVTLDHGLRPGISVDNETSYGTDMFTEMRVLASASGFRSQPLLRFDAVAQHAKKTRG
jgi:hypothetical protein